MKRFIGFLAAFLSLPGCLAPVGPIERFVALRNAPMEPGHGLIYVIREKQIAGMLASMLVFRGNENMGALGNNNYLYFYAPAGETSVSLAHGITNPPRLTSLPLKVEEGKTYYLKARWERSDTLPHVALVPESAGPALLDKSTLVPGFVVVSPRRPEPGTAASSSPSSAVDLPAPLAPPFRRAERPEDFAMVVGIEKYSSLPAAEFAERDAAAVKEHLRALGVPARNIIHLSGPSAGYSSFKKYLESWLPKNVRPGGRVYFYFSGHGAPEIESGAAYLLPWDGDPSFLKDTAYPTKRLYDRLSALPAKEIVVALDACFSGAGGRSVLAKGARPLVVKLEAEEIPANLMVLAAAAGEQITSTLEDRGHGAFTYYFLKGLGGEAKNASGAVTARGLYEYLKPRVQDAARRQNRDQEPVLHAEEDRELIRY